MMLKPQKNPSTIPPSARYSHTVWGVDVNSHPLVAVNGKKHFNSAPVCVYKAKHRHPISI